MQNNLIKGTVKEGTQAAEVIGNVLNDLKNRKETEEAEKVEDFLKPDLVSSAEYKFNSK